MATSPRASRVNGTRGGARPALLLAAVTVWLGAAVSAQVPAGCEDCPPTTAQVGALTGVQAQAGHLLRDSIVSSCAGKTFPGVTVAGSSFFYETVTYRNYGPSACVTVSFDPTAGSNPCGTNAQAAAYQDAYDPMNQANGYLGDGGSSAAGTFLVQVAADSNFLVVITNSVAEDTCSYSLQIDDVPCQSDTTLCELTTAVPGVDLRGRVGLVFLLVFAGVVILRRVV